MTNTMINFDAKSQLAKLIATENIDIQHNNVKTASFDVVNRVLTLPNFKVKNKDVYDMLIAHECAHALFTPAESWKEIGDDKELRSYVNVLEDTRIDKLIQNKYPGIVNNYLNGFDVLNQNDFFSIKKLNINTDLMLIDKINLRSKSLNRLPLNFNTTDKNWLKKVDDLKTFDDVMKLAKEMLDWQKKQIEKLKKLPDFDNHIYAKLYKSQPGQDEGDKQDSNKEDSKSNGDESQDSNKMSGEEINDTDNSTDGNTSKVDDKEKDESGKNSSDSAYGAGGDDISITSLTNGSFEGKREQLVDTKTKYNYVSLPKLKLDNVLVSNKTFLSDFRKHIKSMSDYSSSLSKLKNKFNQFKNDNKRTVQYLVKEFEMKKAATAYKRATTDKTGIIDPLKLKNYKFSDDIFKRLTILPNAKNHGMIMLLDWSGSMHNHLYKTIEQTINLIMFCKQVNIPFELYGFSSEYFEKKSRYDGGYDENGILTKDQANYKHGDAIMDQFAMINFASHKSTKKELDESLLYLYQMGIYYNANYSSYSINGDYYDMIGIPNQFRLGSTPLNEALVCINQLIPLWQSKYKVEKLTLITLTDGGANSGFSYTANFDGKKLTQKAGKEYGEQVIIKDGKKRYTSFDKKNIYCSNERVTGLLLDIIKQKHNITVVGFYLIARINRWDVERYLEDDMPKGIGYYEKQEFMKKKRLSFSKEKFVNVNKYGYDKYFFVNAKSMRVENTDLSSINTEMKTARMKQLFSKTMKGRITSRVLLNNFIAEVA